jgi:hypothetical protein
MVRPSGQSIKKFRGKGNKGATAKVEVLFLCPEGTTLTSFIFWRA